MYCQRIQRTAILADTPMVLSHEDANDLLQNTFIKAWTNLEYFRAEAKMSTWLYRIALNECLTFFK